MRRILGDSCTRRAMTPGGCGGDKDRRERSVRVWLWKDGEGDAVVAAVGVVVAKVRTGTRPQPQRSQLTGPKKVGVIIYNPTQHYVIITCRGGRNDVD